MHFKTMLIFTEKFINTKETVNYYSGGSFPWPRTGEKETYIESDMLAEECLYPFSNKTNALSFYKTKEQIINEYKEDLPSLFETPLGKLYKKSTLLFIMHLLETVIDKKLGNEVLPVEFDLFFKREEQIKNLSMELAEKNALKQIEYNSKFFPKGELGYYTTLNNKAFFSNKKKIFINKDEKTAEKNTLPTTIGFFADEFKLTPDNVKALYSNFVVIDGKEIFVESFIPYKYAEKTYKNLYEFSELALEKRGPNDYIVFYDCFI
jgi:hypothetical protein